MSKATKHSVLLILAFVATAITNYGFAVALSWLIDPAQFGVLGVSQSLLMLLGLAVGSGFAWTTAQDLAFSGVTASTRQRFRTAFLANTCLGILLAGGLWIAYLIKLLPLGPDYRFIIPWVVVTTLILSTRAVVNGAIRGLSKFNSLALNLIVEILVKAALGIVLVLVGFGVEGVMVGFTVGAAIALLHSLFVIRSNQLWIQGSRLDKELITASVPLFLGMLGPGLLINLDILGLKILAPASLSDEMAGLYQAAIILARTPVFIAQTLMLVLFTYAAKMGVSEKNQNDRQYFHTAMKLWLRLLMPACLILILSPKAVLSLFFPSHYLQVSFTLQIAAAGTALIALMTLLNGVIQASGDRRRPAIFAAASVIAQIIVLVILLPSWGTTGAALSLLAAGFVALVNLSPIIYAHYKTRLSELKTSIPRIVLVGLPLFFLIISLLILPDGSKTTSFVKLGLSGLGYCLFLLITNREPSPHSKLPFRQQINQFVNVLMGG